MSDHVNLYGKRDVIRQGEHYLKHINAMTVEGLHSKSDIAAELAHRDIDNERMRLHIRWFLESCDYSKVTTDFLVQHFKNAIKME